MKPELLDYLRAPITREPFSLESDSSEGGVWTGQLVTPSETYPIVRGIPRFLTADELKDQEQTQESFSYKWTRADSFYTESRDEIDDKTFDFMVETEPERYGFEDISEMRQHYESADSILEVGCGSGHYTSLYMTPDYRGKYVGVDLSAGIDIAKERHAGVKRADFVQANLFSLPLKEQAFDIVHCRGVMHHTPSTEAAFKSVSKFVKPGGEFIFLIYRKNGPVREFTDDLIREAIKDQPAGEAWEKLMQLTKFGKALSELNVEVDIPEDVDLLGIKAGKYDIQRLIYNHFVKAFWKSDWSDDESNIISFDWYHPQYVFRHTQEEIEGWCSEEGFEIESIDDRWVGFTVRARKLAA
ncbi:MAG TPA: methyltransferase domain-containing protein [Planctomycetes bacterium]|nr:methyltransferase domain-containing protein [Planctomycetaceae bacterium]HIM28601.1 methyltransferase domain-containing protein [Planctomycetota bacterium]